MDEALQEQAGSALLPWDPMGQEPLGLAPTDTRCVQRNCKERMTSASGTPLCTGTLQPWDPGASGNHNFANGACPQSKYTDNWRVKM